MSPDPYSILGVSRSATDQEVRSAYRKLVQRHHPDHNGGSVESARRFEEVQTAYAAVRQMHAGRRPAAGSTRPPSSGPSPSSAPQDSHIDARMAAMEFELREAQRKREEQLRAQREASRRAVEARERAREAAREAARAGEEAAAAFDHSQRARDEELGYFRTDDSLGAILSDARGEISGLVSHARDHPAVKRVSDLIAGLDDLVSQVDRRKPRDEA